MKRGLTILIIALIAGYAAFCVTRSHRQATHNAVLLDSMPELAWLRSDLKLTDEQFSKASELHAAYRPICVEMCRRISDAHTKLQSLASTSHGMTPELETAIKEHAEVHADCQRKMLEHLYQTAHLFEPQQSNKYLQTMIPHALDSLTESPVSCHKE